MSSEPTKRIAALIEAYHAHTSCAHKSQPERDYLRALAYTETAGEGFTNIRRARYEKTMFEKSAIEVTPGELLIGRFATQSNLTPEQEEIRSRGMEAMRLGGPTSGFGVAATGHRVLDYEKLLNVGLRRVMERIDEKLNALDYSDPDDAEKDVFYRSVKISLEGYLRFAERCRELLLQLAADETDPKQKNEYEAMAANFEKAPAEPCTRFYEALQQVWLIQYATNLIGDITLSGRPGDYLYPFYRRDIDNGVITKEFAQELIDNYFIKHNEIYGAWPAPVMIGGDGSDGRPAWNELEEMCITAISHVGLVNPSVSVAYTPDMPEDLLAKCVDTISKGYTRPSIFNDRVVREGLEAAGVTPEDARNYIHSTCVEITPIGASNCLVANPYINPTKALEYVLGGGHALYGDPVHVRRKVELASEYDSFDAFYADVKAVFAEIIRGAIIGDCLGELSRKRYEACPFSSALINDCIERGKDAGAGGALYNFVYPCFPGFITFVDSLAAIKTAVFDQKELTLSEITRICSDNFKDEERMRQFLINRCEKFGNDQDGVDRIGKDLYDFILDEFRKYRHCVSDNGTFHPSYFAWIMHGRLGLQAAATPNGRKQGEALSENLGASQGMDKNTPLAVVRSIAKLEQKYGIGGIATNFRFSKGFVAKPDGRKALADFIRFSMDNGCFELQFNVVDQQTLLAAKENPDQYRSLMVRVAGYSDYFTSLAPEIQDEIIKRTEHESI